MADSIILTLQNRILQLESNMMAMSQRTKKEIIWKKQLEDWIMQNFHYDLRLQVELKLLESEGRPSNVDNLISSTQQQQNYVPNMIHDPTVVHNSQIQHQQRYFGNQLHNGKRQRPATSRQSQQGKKPSFYPPAESVAHISPNISITTVPASSSSNNFNDTLSSFPNQIANHQIESGGCIITPINFSASNNGEKRKRVQDPSTPVIVSTSSLAKSPELITLDDDDEEVGEQHNTYQSNNVPIMNHHNSEAGSFSEIVNNPVPNAAPLVDPLITDLLNDDSSNGQFYMNSIELVDIEREFAANNYLTRDQGALQFNVKKIILDYNKNLHEELIQGKWFSEYSGHVPLPLTNMFRRMINVVIVDFLLLVYGKQVPREIKFAMAQSLFDTFPSTEQSVWYNKLPHKNAAGLIQNRLHNMRKNLPTSI